MATTTNYGWTTPDDTALVKDGAAAIRTLGSSVDTTTKNLNPETTLGDLAYRSSTANVKTRLALGTANQILRVNSGATAPEWATPSSGALTKINGTSFSAVTSFSLPANTFSATYDNYKIIVNVSTVSAGANFNARLRASGSDDTTSNYECSNVGADYDTSAVTNYNSGNTQSSWTTFGFAASGNPTYYSIEVFNPFASVKTGYTQTSILGTSTTYTGGGRFLATTSFDSMSIIRASGTMTGTYTVYGYEK
jgi:hypothetical protein